MSNDASGSYGRIVATPPASHQCAPGWTYTVAKGGEPPFYPEPGTRYAQLPSEHDYPAGTVWECGDCGRTWVSLRHRPGTAVARFRREHWLERRRRLRWPAS